MRRRQQTTRQRTAEGVDEAVPLLKKTSATPDAGVIFAHSTSTTMFLAHLFTYPGFPPEHHNMCL